VPDARVYPGPPLTGSAIVLDKFWEAAGGGLAGRVAGLGWPAVLFWLGGLLAWAGGHGGLHRLSTLTGWLGRQSTPTQFAAILGVLAAVAGTAGLVDRLTLPALRLLEGYWPEWLGGLRRRLVARVDRRAAREDKAWQKLAPDALERTATADQLIAFARLDQRRRHRPSNPAQRLPTRIGNILRAGECWPTDKYGLDAVGAALNQAVAVALWGLLFCIFAGWYFLALPIGLGVALSAVALWAPPRAEIFADLVESAFDLYRVALYRQLRWPLPDNPAEELARGQELTAYLWRGSDTPYPHFTPPGES
jgi:hypothetical protein